MPKINYVLKDGSRKTIDAANGSSVMETAIGHNVQGIDAECGGCLSCATCHIYVDAAWAAKLPPAEADELEMLEFVAAARQPNSRLGCQLLISPLLDGLVVQIPPTQVAE